MNPDSISITPTETAALTGALFIAVEIFKYVFRINGKVSAVRLMALLLAELFAFGDALFSTPTIPNVTLYLVWNTFLRGLMMTGTTLGIHALRSGMENAANSDGGSETPLEGAQRAITTAQNATAQVAGALNRAEGDVQKASVIADAASDLAAGVSAGNVVGLLTGGTGAAVPSGVAAFSPSEALSVATFLSSRYRMPMAEAYRIATTDPEHARAMAEAVKNAAPAPSSTDGDTIPQ